MILIIDFGSQTTHLIGRRLNELGASAQIILPNELQSVAQTRTIHGIILSGGPSSVYHSSSPRITKKVFSLGIPVLGICYGQQLMTQSLGGKVRSGTIKEYGPTPLTISKHPLFRTIPDQKPITVWMSHGDEVSQLPNGFEAIAQTPSLSFAAIAHTKKPWYAVQFHPEVHHTQYGSAILKNFITFCNVPITKQTINIEAIVDGIRETVGKSSVIMAFSGGTDSFVAAALIARAIGKSLIPVYVDSGLMRPSSYRAVTEIFPDIFGFSPIIIHAKTRFLKSLRGITDPEQKRKIIGALYVKLFEEKAAKFSSVSFLAQGTTYADFIHSKSTAHAALIKSHHNVGGLPKTMQLKLLEPIRYFYTDQVREIGRKLGLPEEVVTQQPFPGPGHAVRIVGAVTPQRLKQQIQADAIVVEEIENMPEKHKIFQYFSVLTGSKSTAIKGDGRFYGEVVALRAYTTKDRMTADIAHLPYPVLQRVATRIVNEVPNISRVTYDITTKPPATMEWE